LAAQFSLYWPNKSNFLIDELEQHRGRRLDHFSGKQTKLGASDTQFLHCRDPPGATHCRDPPGATHCRDPPGATPWSSTFRMNEN